MLKTILRGAFALSVAAVTFGATPQANAADLGVQRPHHRHWHRSGCNAFWPDFRCYYGIPARPYSSTLRRRTVVHG